MKILIAEDDEISRRILQLTLIGWQHEVLAVTNGVEALAELEKENAPSLAILDWMMPLMDGVEVCQRVRRVTTATPPYIILLTAKNEKSDIVTGLDAGANDYLIKPFDRYELRARVQVGARVVELQETLANRVEELEAALAHVRTLEGILPICCYCKSVRDDQNYWQTVEKYVAERSQATFSHGICPNCYENVVKVQLAERKRISSGLS